MTLETWLAFFVACWVISLSPGAGAIASMSCAGLPRALIGGAGATGNHAAGGRSSCPRRTSSG